ncbi:MAG: DUF992 domain-containing protein [Brucellaceae bacterium]|nr:DUF992 domain-containing protein [Brucellaceae bacterium]
MRKTLFAAGALLAAAVSTPAFAEERTELGMLDCVMEGGINLSIISSKELACTFTPADASRPPEAYVGIVSKFGIDIGVTGDKLVRWLVLAPTTDPYAPGALQGDYVGASAEASAVVGGGANVLVGGSNQTLTLQPVSVQAQTGVNIAVGVSQFSLTAVAD